MSKFIASNGYKVELDEDANSVMVEGLFFSTNETTALREFFQAEHDRKNGVWRENPDSEFVVRYVETDEIDGRRVQVFNEKTGGCAWFYEEIVGSREPLPNVNAAKAWFEAHPVEPPPRKAWLDAKPNELWELETDAYLGLMALSTFGGFLTRMGSYKLDNECIRNAVRVYPVAGAS